MAISVVAPGSLSRRRYFVVPGGTNQVGGWVTEPIVPKTDLKTGEPFSLLVRIRNLSTNKTFVFCYGDITPDAKDGLACIVISPSGKDISPRMRSESSEFYVRGGSYRRPLTAQPDQTAQFEFPLSELCKLEEMGTCKITARKTIRDKAGKDFDLTSNSLCVRVVPDK
jgi:hypothetical protein